MTTDEEINILIIEAQLKIDLVISKIFSYPEYESNLYSFGHIGRASGLLKEFQEPIFDRSPHLRPQPPIDYVPDRKMNKEEIDFTSKLSIQKLNYIDELLLEVSTNQYKKVSIIIAYILNNPNIHIKGIPDIFYIQRIKLLVNNGLLQSQGNLDSIRFSEIKLS